MTVSQITKKLPTITLTIAIVALLSFFRKPLNLFLDRIFVKPLISEFENSFLNSWILVLMAVSIFSWLTIYGSKLFLQQLGVIAFGFYFLIKTSGYWYFYSFRLCSFISNWDVVVISLVAPMFLNVFRYKVKIESRFSNGFLEDLPIENADEDGFNRLDFAKEIAKRISLTSNKKSFAIGILGEYGNGKTSFINLIRINLNDEEFSVIEFNPWGIEGKSNIQQDFFDILSSNLYKIDPKISGMVMDYSRKLARTGSSIEKVIKNTGLISSFFHESNYLDDYKRIDNLLAVCDKKIVVVIDDLDRLYSEEVLEVLRIIRNTANFANIFYLVAYDKNYINKAIATLNPNIGASFLDKIIQLEIPLPKRESNYLNLLLEQHLKKFLQEADLNVYSEHIVATGFHSDYQYGYSKIFRQSRDIIKFVNSFKLIYPKLNNEVYFENLFVLELLKFRFPLVYNRLYEDKSEFIHSQAYATLDSQFYELTTYSEDKESKLSIIRTLREEKEYDDDELKLIAGLIHHLFTGWDRVKNARNSIIHPMFFDRYFRYHIGGKEISEKSFKEALGGGLEKVKVFIEEQSGQNMLRETAARLLQVNVSGRSEFELLIKSLFYLGPMFAVQQGLRSFSYDSLLLLLWDTDYNANKLFFKEEPTAFKSMVERIFADAPFPFLFHSELIYHIRTDSRKFLLSDSELTDLQIYYFKAHLDKDGLSQDAVYIFYWCSEELFESLNDGSGKGFKRRRIKDKMAELVVKVLPSYDPVHFLKMSIETDLREKSLHNLNWTFRALYTDPMDLRNAVSTNSKISEEVKNEYLLFFDSCKENGFDKYTEFIFKTALKDKLQTSIPL